jgi:hypothetical protein
MQRSRLIVTRKRVFCCQGSTSVHTHYGLALARSGGLSPGVLADASSIVAVLQRKQARHPR